MNNRNTGLNLLFFLITLNISLFAQINDPVTKENIDVKITEALKEYELNDRLNIAIDVLFFIDDNNLKLKNDCSKTRVSFLRALKSRFQSKPKPALDYAKEALQLASNCDRQILIARIYLLIGEIQRNDKTLFNKDLLAIANFKKALSIFEKGNHYVYTIDAYYGLSFQYFSMGNWEESIKSGLICIENIKNYEHKRNRIKYLYTNLAFCNIKLKKYDQAIIALENAQENCPDNNNYTLANINKGYAEINYQKGNYKLAYSYLKISDSYKTKRTEVQTKRLIAASDQELQLNTQLLINREKSLKEHKYLISFCVLFFTLSFLIGIKFFKSSNKLKKSLDKIHLLNRELQIVHTSLKNTNSNLEQQYEKTEVLLNLNERTLFSKILKISTYNDSIAKVGNEISNLIKSNSEIKTNQLHQIEKSLLSIVSDEELWEDFKFQFEKIKPDFFKKLKLKCPTLSVNDLKHCSYIISKLNTKDVANLISVSPRSVETTRYRIKKKLGLEKDINLYDFLQNL